MGGVYVLWHACVGKRKTSCNSISPSIFVGSMDQTQITVHVQQIPLTTEPSGQLVCVF